MYKLLRDIHLVLGGFAGLFLFLYAVSAFTFSVKPIRDLGSRTSAYQEVALDLPRDAPLPEVELRLRRAGIQGVLWDVSTSSSATILRFSRPGRDYNVDWDFGPVARVEVLRPSLLALLEGVHETSGMGNPDTITNLWGALVLIMSIVTLGLGMSGVWLWWLRHAERRVGGVLLAVSTLLAVTLFVVARL